MKHFTCSSSDAADMCLAVCGVTALRTNCALCLSCRCFPLLLAVERMGRPPWGADISLAQVCQPSPSLICSLISSLSCCHLPPLLLCTCCFIYWWLLQKWLLFICWVWCDLTLILKMVRRFKDLLLGRVLVEFLCWVLLMTCSSCWSSFYGFVIAEDANLQQQLTRKQICFYFGGQMSNLVKQMARWSF